MNLTFLLFSALTCVTSATPETAHIVYDEVEAAFQVNSKVQPDENADNNEFIGQCIASSFNTVHANTEYRLDSIDLESENVGPGTGLSGTHQLAGRKLHHTDGVHFTFSNLILTSDFPHQLDRLLEFRIPLVCDREMP